MAIQRTMEDLRAERHIRSGMWVLAGIGAIFLATQWIVNDSVSELVYAGIAFVVLSLTLRILGSWRDGFLIFFVWLLFEDLVRKYMGNNMLIFFAKDFLVGVTYVAFLVAARRHQVKVFRPPFLMSLAFLVWLAAIQIFNPNSPSVLYGILGLKIYFYYAGLMYIGYALINNEETLRKFLVLNMALAGVIAVLGIIQSIVGLDFLNPRNLAPELQALGRLTRMSPITHEAVARPTSVFVSDGRFASYMMMMFIIGLGTAAYMVLRKTKGQIIVFITIPLIALGGYMSGSRGAIVYDTANAVILSLGILWGSQRGAGLRLISVLQRSAMLVCLAVITVIVLYPKEVGARWAFYSETLFPSSSAYELTFRAWDYPIDNFLYTFRQPNWIWGNGTGTASNGVQYVSVLIGQRPPAIGVENGWGTLILEMGIIAPLLWVIFSFSFIRSGYLVLKSLKKTYLFPIALSILYFSFLLLGPLTFGGITQYHNYVYNAYFWILAGILFRLPSLVQQPPVAQSAAGSARGV
jgi:hypothetical protein